MPKDSGWPSVEHDLLRAAYPLMGEAYLAGIVDALAQRLGARRVFIARADDEPPTQVTIVAESQHEGPCAYALDGTPCRTLYAERQPVHLDLPGGERYHGYPFIDAAGNCHGHLALLVDDGHPLPEELEPLLCMLATRAGGELTSQYRNARLAAAEHRLDRHNRILRMTAAHEPLGKILDTLLLGIESDHPGAICSIVGPDSSGKRLHKYAAPSLPAPFLAAIEGIAIGPDIGSCGAALYTGERVIATDLATHPNWAAWRNLTLRFGLRSCWSQPIVSAGRVLGAFAIYHADPRTPGPSDFAIIDQVADLTCQVLLQHEAMEALRQKGEHYRLLLRHGADGTVVLDQDGRFVEVSTGFLAQIGVGTIEELSNTRVWDWITSFDEGKCRRLFAGQKETPVTVQIVMRRADGTLWDAEVTTTAVTIEGKRLSWASARDITERKRFEAQLLHEAHIDSLTGIANRRCFMETLEDEFGRARRYRLPLSVLMLDLDHFKAINDRYGHSAGDEVLRTLCRESAPLLRKEDQMGRLGGEEFGVLLPHTPLQHAADVAQRLLARAAALRIPSVNPGENIIFSCSIGVASLMNTDSDTKTLLVRADRALYRAKQAGRGCISMDGD
jgi:diguanylate cyclase (GGDEF)-like protein/PAS domain S-box-containing protein